MLSGGSLVPAKSGQVYHEFPAWRMKITLLLTVSATFSAITSINNAHAGAGNRQIAAHRFNCRSFIDKKAPPPSLSLGIAQRHSFLFSDLITRGINTRIG
jgi:hypothetical protein